MSKTYVVVHPKLHSALGGKTQKLVVGTEVELTDEQAKRLGDKVKPLQAAGKIDLAKAEAEAKEKARAEAEKAKKK